MVIRRPFAVSTCPQNTLGKHVLHPHLQQKDGEARLWSSPCELLWSSGVPSQFARVHKTPWGNMSSTHTSNKKMAKLVCGRHLVSFCGHRASPRSFKASTSALHPLIILLRQSICTTQPKRVSISVNKI